MSAMTISGYPGLLTMVRQGAIRVRTHSGNLRRTGPLDPFTLPSFPRPASYAPDSEPLDLFVALPQAVADGENAAAGAGGEAHIPAAIEAGVAFVLCRPACIAWVAEHIDALGQKGFRQLPVFVEHPSPRQALGELAAAEYRLEADAPRLVGITGTNGKTTSSYLLESILRTDPLTQIGLLGTIEYRWPGHHEDSPLTTPGCLELHAMLRSMRDAGVHAAIMEVSSHALDQERVAGLRFDGALFTNLTQDHMDYHPDVEHYFRSKARLFRPTRDGGFPMDAKAMAINYDDPFGRRLYTECATTSRHIAYGFGDNNNPRVYLQGRILKQGPQGLHLHMTFGGQCWELQSPLVGEFNADNLLGVQAMALGLGCTPAHCQALAAFRGVPGRLERVADRDAFSVFVDYAHTPDALEKALSALKGAGFSRIVTVFGCGGDRDKTKRPRMGEAAARHSVAVVLTSDNPRTEDPQAIMADVRPGLAACPCVQEIPDRKEAITRAMDLLRAGDALLIAGKGHETYQIIGKTKYPFSDQATVREVLGCA